MDKTFIKFLILLLFLYFISLKQSKESFIQIDLSQIQTDCNAIDANCNKNFIGGTGWHCNPPDNRDQYNIINEDEISDTNQRILSDNIDLVNTSGGCSEGNELVNAGLNDSFYISSCQMSETPYTLTGCQTKCTKPTEDNISDMYNNNIKLIKK